MFQKSRLRGEVILVNDGSEDETLQMANEAASKHRWLRVSQSSHQSGHDCRSGYRFFCWPAAKYLLLMAGRSSVYAGGNTQNGSEN